MVVSVCMITYGHEKYILEAIEGILMQRCTFTVELIIANDSSPDTTDDVIQKALGNHPNASWIRYIKQEKNIGMMPNFITAIQQCNGNYIALCDGDDFWTDPLKLQKQIDFLEAHPDYVLSFHKVKILKKDATLVDDFITRVPDNYEEIETLAKSGNYIHTPSVVFRNVIKKYPFEFVQSPIGDYFLYMMLAEHGKLGYSEETMAVYRYEIGIYSGADRIEKVKKVILLLTTLLSYLKEDKIKQIILERQFRAIEHYRFLIEEEIKESIILDAKLFKNLKKIYKKLLKKVYRNLNIYKDIIHKN